MLGVWFGICFKLTLDFRSFSQSSGGNSPAAEKKVDDALDPNKVKEIDSEVQKVQAKMSENLGEAPISCSQPHLLLPLPPLSPLSRVVCH